MDDHVAVHFKNQQAAVSRFAAIDAEIIQPHALIDGAKSVLVAQGEFLVKISHATFFLGALLGAFGHARV